MSGSAVFTYGSLMYDPVWTHVVGGRHRSVDATLDGHRRLTVDGEAYPALVPAPGAQVRGRLYFEVDEDGLVRLDAFEGVEYRRVSATVRADDGSACRAELYLWVATERLGRDDWDPQRFEREGLAPFLERYASGVRRPSAAGDGSGSGPGRS